MKIRLIPILIFLISVVASCASSESISSSGLYYLVTTSEPVITYQSKSLTGDQIIIPAGKQFFVEKAKGKYMEVLFFGRTGFIAKRQFVVSKSYTYKQLSEFGLTPDSSYSYGYKPLPIISKDTVVKKNYVPYSPSGGSVNVKGYYRKNGTYVKPHTRSAPRKH